MRAEGLSPDDLRWQKRSHSGLAKSKVIKVVWSAWHIVTLSLMSTILGNSTDISLPRSCHIA